MPAWYLTYRRCWEASYWITIALVSIVTNANLVLADYQRRAMPVLNWEPWLWESSSQLILLLLIPAVLWLDRRYPPHYGALRQWLLLHLAVSVLFCLLHVTGMVAIRQVGYTLAGLHYNFGNWPAELWYEYRKDIFSYAGILSTFYIYRFIFSRLLSEAHPISHGETSPAPVQLEHLLVKKLGKEFIIRISEIDYIEAAGNYMNLHVGGRLYPLRDTMAALEQKLGANFVRVHRSIIVNLDSIADIRPLDSGDYKIRLHNNTELNASRRYHDRLKQFTLQQVTSVTGAL